jgi:hypothetical protein
MRTRISGALLVTILAALAACQSEKSEGAPAAPPAPAEGGAAPGASSSATASSASASAALLARGAEADGGADAGVDPLCAAILKAEKLDEGAMRLEDRTRPGPRLLCASTGRFAWAVRVDPPAPPGSSVQQAVIFSSADGAHGRVESRLDKVDWPPVLGRHTMMFDIDNDGVPEFFAPVPANVRTYEPASRIFVTFKKGAISPYPAGLGAGYLVDRVADIDGDGRPDLRVRFELGKRTVCQPGEDEPLRVELVAHGLKDGTFTLDDPLTWAEGRRHCPAMPAPDAIFVASAPPAPDPRDLSMAYISCSRLRGKPAGAVIAELSAACKDSADAGKCGGPCRHLADAIAVARFTPPLQLTDARDAGPAHR